MSQSDCISKTNSFRFSYHQTWLLLCIISERLPEFFVIGFKMGDSQYKLRATLQGHSMDVKSVFACAEPAGALLTTSRDQTARLWYQQEDNSYNARKVYRGHTKYVSCAVYVEPSEEYPSGLIYTGCQDGKIRTFLPDVEEPLHLLEGHAENVTSIFVGKFGSMISGSWDTTAKVWMQRKVELTNPTTS